MDWNGMDVDRDCLDDYARKPERKVSKERPVTKAQIRFMQAMCGRPIRIRDRIFYQHDGMGYYIARSSVYGLVEKGLIHFTEWGGVELTDAGRNALRHAVLAAAQRETDDARDATRDGGRER